MSRAKHREECAGRAFPNHKDALGLVVFFMIALALSSYASALPAIELDTTLNSEQFDTLPLLGITELVHVANTSYNGSQLNTNVEIDLVRGDIPETKWWDGSYRYRRPITFILPSGFTNNYTVMLEIDISEMLGEGKLRDDHRDLRLVEDDEAIPFHIEEISDGLARVSLRLPDNRRTRDMDIYYGKPSQNSMPEAVSRYRLTESFDSLERWNVTSGSYDISGQVLNSEFNATSRIMLMNLSDSYDSHTETKESSPLTIQYRFRLSTNSSLKFILSENKNLSGYGSNITFDSSSGNSTICVASSCAEYETALSEDTWYDINLSLTDNRLRAYLGGEKFADRSQLLGSYYIFFESNSTTNIDDMKLYKYAPEREAVLDEEQELIQKYDTTAPGGEFGWTYELTGMDSQTMYIRTEAEKNNYEQASAIDTITTNYERISIDIREKGTLTKIGEKYIASAPGTITFTNPNSRNVTISLAYDTEMDLFDLYGNRFINSRILLDPLKADSSEEIEYHITGVSLINPVEEKSSLLGSAILRGGDLDENYEFKENSFTEKKEVTKVSPKKDSLGSTIETTRENTFVLESLTESYAGLSFNIKKTLSLEKVEPGDILDVQIKVDNIDVVAREVTVKDQIPEEFVYIEGVNKQVPGKKNLSWRFNMNRKSSKLLDYRMMYIGNSTGAKLVEGAEVISLIGNISSDNSTIFRDQPRDTEVYVQKKVRYLYDDKARIYINIVNTGDFTIDEMIVKELIGESEFSESSVRTPFRAEWIVKDFNPGEEWRVSYLTEEHELVENHPQVYSEDVNIESIKHLRVSEEDDAPKGLWEEERSFLMPLLLMLALLAEMISMFFYIHDSFRKEYLLKEIEKAETSAAAHVKGYASKLKETYEKAPELPKRVLSRLMTVFKRIYRLGVFAYKHSIIFTKLSFIWLANTLPFLWHIFDKIRKLNMPERLIIIKLFRDMANEKIKFVVGKLRSYQEEKKKQKLKKEEKPGKGSEGNDENREDGEKQGQSGQQEDFSTSSQSQEDRKNSEYETSAYNTFRQNQKTIEKMMRDLKK